MSELVEYMLPGEQTQAIVRNGRWLQITRFYGMAWKTVFMDGKEPFVKSAQRGQTRPVDLPADVKFGCMKIW